MAAGVIFNIFEICWKMLCKLQFSKKENLGKFLLKMGQIFIKISLCFVDKESDNKKNYLFKKSCLVQSIILNKNKGFPF